MQSYVNSPTDRRVAGAEKLLTPLPLLPGFSGVLCPFPFISIMHLFCMEPIPLMKRGM